MKKEKTIDLEKIPKHVAIIMDGNGRWAKEKGMNRIFGHKNALTAVRESIEGAAEIGIKAITLFAFSTENWNRPKLEIDALMSLLISSLKKELNAGITIKESNCVYNTQKLIGGLDLIKDNKYLQHDITIPHIYSNKNLKCLAECCKGKRTKIRYINYDSDNMKYLYICNECYYVWKNSDSHI